ncbi:hypothetical protein HY994_03045 [Candidatus Micrarchaeota archaeon]|nr:hypothetical protein [Candidatus Micrarchaeota archaeon]
MLEAIASHAVNGPNAALELKRPPAVELLLHLKADIPVEQRRVSGVFRKDGRRLLSFLSKIHGIKVTPRLPRKILDQPFQRTHSFDIGSLDLPFKAAPVWKQVR